jgi:hypothetical protein
MAAWSELKIKLIETGDETGTWGVTTNENFNNVIEQAITGSATVTFSDADITLPLADSTDLQDARALRLNLTGTVTATRTLFVPNIQKFYIINNGLTEAITVQNTTGAGDALTIPAGRSTLVFNDATDIINPNTYFAGAVLSDAAVILGGAINATPIGGISASTGAFTTLGATSATLTNPLPVTSGGTGVALSTGTGSVVLSASPTLTGTPLAPTATALTNTTQIATTAFVTGAVSTATGSLGTMSTQNANAVAITGGTITGITDLAVADGGTGSSTLAANNVLLGNGTSALQTVAPSTSGNILTSNGTTWASTAPSGLGIGQTWTTFTSVTRVFNTTYTNSTGKPISVFASALGTSPSNSIGIQFYVNQGTGDVLIYSDSEFSTNSAFATSCTGIVPNGATYRITVSGNGGGTPVFNAWSELR